MHVRDLGTDLTIDDNPILDRWIGVFNFLIAGGCAWIGLTNYNPGGDLRDILLILIVPFAITVAVLGLWRAVVQPATVLHVDGVQQVVTVVRRSALRRITRRWRADQVAGFSRSERLGRDGDKMFRLSLDLVDGASIPVVTLWRPDAATIDAVVGRANALLGK